MNGEIVSMFVTAHLANISINFIAGCCRIKTKHLDKMSAKVSKNVNNNIFAIFTTSNNTTLGKKKIKMQHFVGSDFPR